MFVDKVINDIQEVNPSEPLSETVPEILDISQNLLFQRLAALRKQIAKEEKLQPYIIFHDTSLKDH